MLRTLLQVRSARNQPNVFRGNPLFRVLASRNISSDVAQQEDPNFHEMTEFFIENARFYVEERLANKAEGPGKRPIPPEQKRQSVKGKFMQHTFSAGVTLFCECGLYLCFAKELEFSKLNTAVVPLFNV